jgi:hypothetical protein
MKTEKNTFYQWKKCQSNRKKALNWLGNAQKTDSQSGGLYDLKVRLGKESVEYCGQAYAGANNYHSCPEEFIKYVEMAIIRKFTDITDEAMRIMKNEEDKAAIAAKDGILDQLKEIEEIENNKQNEN